MKPPGRKWLVPRLIGLLIAVWALCAIVCQHRVPGP
jgi:hypothetical protein